MDSKKTHSDLDIFSSGPRPCMDPENRSKGIEKAMLAEPKESVCGLVGVHMQKNLTNDDHKDDENDEYDNSNDDDDDDDDDDDTSSNNNDDDDDNSNSNSNNNDDDDDDNSSNTSNSITNRRKKARVTDAILGSAQNPPLSDTFNHLNPPSLHSTPPDQNPILRTAQGPVRYSTDSTLLLPLHPCISSSSAPGVSIREYRQLMRQRNERCQENLVAQLERIKEQDGLITDAVVKPKCVPFGSAKCPLNPRNREQPRASPDSTYKPKFLVADPELQKLLGMSYSKNGYAFLGFLWYSYSASEANLKMHPKVLADLDDFYSRHPSEAIYKFSPRECDRDGNAVKEAWEQMAATAAAAAPTANQGQQAPPKGPKDPKDAKDAKDPKDPKGLATRATTRIPAPVAMPAQPKPAPRPKRIPAMTRPHVEAFPLDWQGPFARAIMAGVRASPIDGADKDFFFRYGLLTSNSMITLEHCIRSKPWIWRPYTEKMLGDQDPLPELEVEALEVLEKVADESRILQSPDPRPIYLANNVTRYSCYYPSEIFCAERSWDELRQSHAVSLNQSGLGSGNLYSTKQVGLAPWELPTPDMPGLAGAPEEYSKLLEHRFERIGLVKVTEESLTRDWSAEPGPGESREQEKPSNSRHPKSQPRGKGRTVGAVTTNNCTQNSNPTKTATSVGKFSSREDLEKYIFLHTRPIIRSDPAELSSQKIVFHNAAGVTKASRKRKNAPEPRANLTDYPVCIHRLTSCRYSILFKQYPPHVQEITAPATLLEYIDDCYRKGKWDLIGMQKSKGPSASSSKGGNTANGMNTSSSSANGNGDGASDSCGAGASLASGTGTVPSAAIASQETEENGSDDMQSTQSSNEKKERAKRGRAAGFAAIRSRKPNEPVYVLKKYSKASSWLAEAYPHLVKPEYAHEEDSDIFTFFDSAENRSAPLDGILGVNERREFMNHGVIAESDLVHVYPNLYKVLVENGTYPMECSHYERGITIQTTTRTHLRKSKVDVE
jgi:hypothetical protein